MGLHELGLVAYVFSTDWPDSALLMESGFGVGPLSRAACALRMEFMDI